MSGLRWVLPACIFLSFAGCTGKARLPNGILPRDKMEAVIWDMAQADQYANLYVAKDSAKVDLKTETLKLYEEVFRLHDVTREEFSKSYRYYLDHPEMDQVLFDSVMAQGARARTEMYDRPFYHPPAVPVVRPARPTIIPGKTGGAMPLRPVVGVVPGQPIGAAMRRYRDSIARAKHIRTDTTKRGH